MQKKQENKAIVSSGSVGSAGSGVLPVGRLPGVTKEPTQSLTIGKKPKKPK